MDHSGSSIILPIVEQLVDGGWVIILECISTERSLEPAQLAGKQPGACRFSELTGYLAVLLCALLMLSLQS